MNLRLVAPSLLFALSILSCVMTDSHGGAWIPVLTIVMIAQALLVVSVIAVVMHVMRKNTRILRQLALGLFIPVAYMIIAVLLGKLGWINTEILLGFR